nr:MAG TPA: Ig-like domain protein [Caudoviricetes sp.]
MTSYRWGKYDRDTRYRTEQVKTTVWVKYDLPIGTSSKDRVYRYYEEFAEMNGLTDGIDIRFAGYYEEGYKSYGGYYEMPEQKYRNKQVPYYVRGSKIGIVTSTNRNAYPDNNYSGSYWYVYEGIDNQAPTISGKDEDLGGYKKSFKRYYSVDDADKNQELNVTVTLNGVTIATVNNATRNTNYPIDIDDNKFNALTLNQQNTVEITVTDPNGATAVRRYTFKRINSAPVVTMTNAHYGEQNKPFSISFEAKDPDDDEITAKVFIDDVQIKDLGKVSGKQTITLPKIDFAKIPNGEHKIRVEAKDSYNAVGAGYADFSKNLTYAWYRLKKELSEQPSAVIVNPLVELATGAKMTIKVCCNVMDSNPTWEAVPEELYGQKYNFRTKSKTANNWGVGVEVKVDKDKATDTSYLYGMVGAYM